MCENKGISCPFRRIENSLFTLKLFFVLFFVFAGFFLGGWFLVFFFVVVFLFCNLNMKSRF